MALNNMGLGFIFTAKDNASATMAKVEGRFKSLDTTTNAAQASFKKNVKTAVGGLGVAAAGAAGLAVAFGAANKYADFEMQLAKVGAITRASAEDMADLKQKAIEAGMATQFSPDEAMAGLGALGARGFTAAEAMKALDGALDLAAGGQIGIEQASSTTAAALRVFGHQALEAGDAADKLLKISNLTAIQAGDLELMLGTVSRGAGLTKQSLEEMAIAMGLVKNTGVDASVAASGVSSALQFIAKNKSAFEELGVAVTDAEGNFLPFIDIVKQTDEQLSAKIPNAADRAAKATELFGKFGVSAFQGISTQINTGIRDAEGTLLQGADAVAYLRKEMEESTGTAAKFKDQLLDTFEGQKTILKGVWQTLGVVSGEAFAQGLKPVVTAISKGLGALIAIIQNTPAPIKKFVGAVFMIAAALTLVTGLTIAAVAGFALLKSTVLAFSGPLLMAAKLFTGLGLAALVLVGIFKVLKAGFDKNVGGFADTLTDLWGKVQLFIDGVKALTSGDGMLRGELLAKLTDPANKSILRLLQRFQQARYRFKMFVQGMREGWAQVLATMGPTFKSLGVALRQLFAAFGFGGKGVDLLTSKSETFREKGEMIGRLVGFLAKILVNGLTFGIKAATFAVNMFKGAWMVFKPILLGGLWVLSGIVKVLSFIVELFADTSERANENGRSWEGLAKVVGGAVAVFLAAKGAIMLVRGAIIAYRAVMLAAAAVQAGFAAAAGAASMAMLGPAGLVVAALAVGAAIGMLANSAGADDWVADQLESIWPLTEELNNLDAAYRRHIKTRGQVGFFKDLEKAAEAQGMTVTAYAEQRATEISNEQTAQRLGLNKDEIKRRLLAGEDVYKELSGPKQPEAGLNAAADGAVDATDAQAKANAQAMEQVLGKDGQPIVINNTLKIGDEDIAKTMQQLDAAMAALNFEADMTPVGA